MSTKHEAIFKALAEPFAENEVKTRTQAGRALKYITARQAMNRLDDVLGPEGWHFDLKPWGADLIGVLTLRLPDGTEVRKSDVGGRAGMNTADDDAKSAASDCLKRCAAQAGVGRELYGDGVAEFVDQQPARQPERKPEWGTAHRGPSKPAERKEYGEPKTGGQLFAWAKRQEEENGVGLIKYIDTWSRLQDFPKQWKDWDAEQVRLGFAEASNKLESVAVAN